jgi:hypothetical protein
MNGVPGLLSPLEQLLFALHETRLMHACPFLNGKGTCVTGCGSGPSPEPHCITDCPSAKGWQPEITLIELLVAQELERDEERYAGGCAPRTDTSYHPWAPPGLSFCHGCRRTVVRGMGRWWE